MTPLLTNKTGKKIKKAKLSWIKSKGKRKMISDKIERIRSGKDMKSFSMSVDIIKPDLKPKSVKVELSSLRQK